MGDTAGGGAGGEMQPQLQSSGSGGNGGGNGGGGVGDVEEEGSAGGLIVPTTETSKHTFFLQLALQHGFPFGQYSILSFSSVLNGSTQFLGVEKFLCEQC